MRIKEFEILINKELKKKNLNGLSNNLLLDNLNLIICELTGPILDRYKIHPSKHGSTIKFNYYGSENSSFRWVTPPLRLKVDKTLSKKESRTYDFKEVFFEPYYDEAGREIGSFEEYIEYCDKIRGIYDYHNQLKIDNFIDLVEETNELKFETFLKILERWENLSPSQRKKIKEMYQKK